MYQHEHDKWLYKHIKWLYHETWPKWLYKHKHDINGYINI